MLRKLICILGVLATIPVYAQTIPERVDALILAINQKDVPQLLKMVDDSCVIANLPRGRNTLILPAILEKFTPIATYKIANQESIGEVTKVQLDVKYLDNREGHPYFVFGKEKVKELGIIKSARIQEPEMPVLAGIFPEKVVLPFMMRNGLIFIEAELNGQKGYFQLDSGCPVIILNRKYAPQIQGNPFSSFSGLNGSMHDVRLSTVSNLRVGAIEITNNALVSSPMDIPEISFLGLLGYEWMKHYVVTFDYKNQILTLEKTPDHTKALLSISFSQERHIPIIPLTIKDKTYRLGIDCGANANVIYQPHSAAVSPLLEEVMTENVGGAEGSIQKSITGYLPEAKIESLLFKDMFMAMTENKINVDASHQLPIQGLLGTPFLQLYKTVINFPAKTIAFYKN